MTHNSRARFTVHGAGAVPTGRTGRTERTGRERGRVLLTAALLVPLLAGVPFAGTAAAVAVPGGRTAPAGDAVPVSATEPPAGSGGASASPGTVQLPVIPSVLPAGATRCTAASDRKPGAVPWAQAQLGLERLGRYGQGAGVVVGVVDTGVSAGAPLLRGRVRAVGAAGQDCVGHGTFVAGVIAASAAPVGGGGGFSGVAPQARIVAERGTDTAGTVSAALVAQGIRAAVDAGATVVDVSAALPKTTADLTSAVAYALAHDVLLVAPAAPDGTAPTTAADGSVPPTAYWPAAANGVLSVLDTTIDGGRPKGAYVPRVAELAAPGDGITGIGPAGSGFYIGSGPSVAAAFAAGTAALVRANRPGLSAAEVARRLAGTGSPGAVPLLDPYRALSEVLPVTGPPSPAAVPPVRLPATTPGGGGAVRRAGILSGCCAVLLLLVAAGAGTARRARSARLRQGR